MEKTAIEIFSEDKLDGMGIVPKIAANISFEKEPKSIGEFEKMFKKKYSKFIKAGKSKDGFKHAMSSVYFFYKFMNSGEKIFHLTENLVNYLSATSPKNIPSSHFKLPFESVYFSLPRKQVFIDRIGDDDVSEMFSVIGVSVTEMSSKSKGERAIHIVIYYSPESGDKTDLISSTYVSVFSDNADIDISINKSFKSWSNGVSEKVSKRVETRTIPVIHLIVNACLYLASNKFKDKYNLTIPQLPKPATKNPKKVRRIVKKFMGKSVLPHYRVGDEIKIDIFQHERPKGKTFGEKFHYSYRFIVRGHWRCYKGGKIIWIKPHYKGATTEDIVNKEYKVTA